MTAVKPRKLQTRSLVLLLLFLVLATAATLRLYNLRWDGGTFPHPDERSTLMFYAPTIRLPESGVNWLDPRQSTLNPFWNVERQERRSYTYGHFPLYMLVATGAAFDALTPHVANLSDDADLITFFDRADTPMGYAVLGRGMVALLDVLSVWLVFLIARRIYNDWLGLLAAAFSALAVSHIQLAHFFAVDPVSTTFTLLVVYASLRMYDEASVGMAILAGIGIGLAVSSKYSALPVVLVPAVAALMLALKPPKPALETDPVEPDAEASETHAPAQETAAASGSMLERAAYLLTLAAVVSFLSFAMTSPFVLLDFENFQTAVMEEQGNMVRGLVDFPFTRQYRDTLPYIYFIEQQIRWGLGWPLGLLAFAGLAWALFGALRGRLHPGEWLILAWIVPYFGATGLFLAKFMRYMSPVTPFAIILGCGLLLALWRRTPRWIVPALAGVVLLGTAGWAAMFVNGVYGTEHSWVTTSRWIYENVPEGSCIAREHWEEGVPMGLQEPGMSPGAKGYIQPQMPMYEADTEQKFFTMRQILRDCDYFVLASNRMSRTLPRLEERYPLSTRYYEALFAGELGYELVATFETPPRLGPLVIDDQAADESFTVYDHPRAHVFRKARELSDEAWFAVLGNTWQGAQHNYLGRPTIWMRLEGIGVDTPPAAGTDEFQTWLSMPMHTFPTVNDGRWNRLATEDPVLGTLVWWLAVQLIALITLPFSFLLFAPLPDRGYLLSKSLGLLLLSYVVWLLASFGLPANRLEIIVAFLFFFLGLSIFLISRFKDEMQTWLRTRWPLLLAGEAVFTFVFLFFVALRLGNPDLWQPWNGGEKMLEMGFLNAIVRSAVMPPYDPFFAGTYINYYYYGMFVVGILIKLTGIAPETAFNLAVPMLAALTAANVFCLATNLVTPFARSRWQVLQTGLFSVLLVNFISNLEGMGQFLRDLASVSTLPPDRSVIPLLDTVIRAGQGFMLARDGTPIPEYNFWDPSRVIPATINEFPYWSFLFADLHPHMMVMPFAVMFLALALAWLKTHAAIVPSSTVAASDAAAPPAQTLARLFRTELVDWRQRLSGGLIWRSLALAFVLGTLAVINTWDLPTYLGVMTAAFVLARYRSHLHPLTPLRAVVLSLQALLVAGGLLLLSQLLYWPFFRNYQALDVGLGLIRDLVPLNEFLKIWGLFLFIGVTWLLVQFHTPATRFGLLRLIGSAWQHWRVLPRFIHVYRLQVRGTSSGLVISLFVLLAALVLALVLWVIDWRTLAVSVVLVLAFFLLLLRWEGPPERAFLELLLFTGLLILLGVQIVFLRDFLGGGDFYRMNTYFKFFIQVWVLFGVAGGVMLSLLWWRSYRWRWYVRMVWQGGMLLLIFASLVFLILGTRSRLDNRFPGPRPMEATLDGMAYMTVGQFTWDGVTYELWYDHEALTWMQNELDGAPVIAEAKIGYYREWGMRVAAYTGFPSILGGLHQNEQHPPVQLGRRDQQVRQFWQSGDLSETQRLIGELGIEYIYMGQLERAIYGMAAEQRFEMLAEQGVLELVFSNTKTRIYRVTNPTALSQTAVPR